MKPYLRRTFLFGFLSFVLILLFIFLGLPLLVKTAVFFGNLRTSLAPAESKDTLAPLPPRFNSLPEATNSAQISVSGLTEAGAEVEVFLNRLAVKKVKAKSDGTFLISSLKLELGDNEIYASATDEAGNVSNSEKKLKIVYDTTAPEIDLFEPADGETFSHRKTVVEIKGETEPKARVTINGHFVILDNFGKFNYPFNLNEGENKIKIVVIDQAGNQTEKEITVKRG